MIIINIKVKINITGLASASYIFKALAGKGLCKKE